MSPEEIKAIEERLDEMAARRARAPNLISFPDLDSIMNDQDALLAELKAKDNHIKMLREYLLPKTIDRIICEWSLLHGHSLKEEELNSLVDMLSPDEEKK